VKLFDTLLGRTKPVKANLDALFSLPSASITLQVSAGYVPTGKAGVCFKPPSGQPFAEVQAEIEQLLRIPDDETSAANNAQVHVHDVADSFGYRWIVVEGQGIDDLVTRIHVVHSSLEDAGWSTQILCSVFAFGHCIASGANDSSIAIGPSGDPAAAIPPSIDKSYPVIYLVYLAKRGSFYPFAPTGKERRDNELELSLKSTIGSDLPIEEDLSRWFPLWDLPFS
jgi:hypothetical protein